MFWGYYSHLQVRCLDPSAGCPDGTYTGPSIVPYLSLLSGQNPGVCFACDPLCAVCSGPTTMECSACSHATILSQNGQRECVDSCIGISNCFYCDTECFGCIGPNPTNCITCKNTKTSWNGTDLCVPPCSNDTYIQILPSGKSECDSCDRECNRCNGSRNTDCISCRHYSQETSNGGVMCLASCPDGTYANAASNCQPCHQDCKTCSGPTNTECFVCQGEADSVNRNTNVNCGKTCPIGYMYDIEGGDCDLIM